MSYKSLAIVVPRLTTRATASQALPISRRYISEQIDKPVFGRKEKALEDQYVKHHEHEQLNALHQAQTQAPKSTLSASSSASSSSTGTIESENLPTEQSAREANVSKDQIHPSQLASERYTYLAYLKDSANYSLEIPWKDREPFRSFDATFFRRVEVYP